MSQLHTTGFWLKCKAFLLVMAGLAITYSSIAQTYYSQFPNAQAASHITTSKPTGTFCLAPSITNSSNLTNNSLTDYARISALLTVPLTCNTSLYKLKADLNLGGLASLPAGYNTGFHIQTSSLLNLSLLGSNITINTYLDGALADTKSGANLLGLDLLALNGDANVSMLSTKPFNQVELVLNSSLVEIGILINLDIYNAFAQSNVVLPVNLTNFKGIIDGNNASLAWAAPGENGTNRYEIERSGDQNVYKNVGMVKATSGNNATKNYSFTDPLSVKGRYTYRLKIYNNDGSFFYSNEILVDYQLATKMFVYPNVVKRGEMLWIKTEEIGKLLVQIFDMQGKQVYNKNINSSGLTSISTTRFIAGTYAIQVTTLSGNTYKKKFFTN